MRCKVLDTPISQRWHMTDKQSHDASDSGMIYTGAKIFPG